MAITWDTTPYEEAFGKKLRGFVHAKVRITPTEGRGIAMSRSGQWTDIKAAAKAAATKMRKRDIVITVGPDWAGS